MNAELWEVAATANADTVNPRSKWLLMDAPSLIAKARALFPSVAVMVI